MRKMVLTLSALIVVALMVSTATAVPVANGQSVADRLSEVQKLFGNLSYQDDDHPVLMAIFKLLLYAYRFVYRIYEGIENIAGAIHAISMRADWIGFWLMGLFFLGLYMIMGYFYGDNDLLAVPVGILLCIIGLPFAIFGLIVMIIGDLMWGIGNAVDLLSLIPSFILLILLVPLNLLARILGIDLEDPSTWENQMPNQRQLQMIAAI